MRIRNRMTLQCMAAGVLWVLCPWRAVAKSHAGADTFSFSSDWGHFSDADVAQWDSTGDVMVLIFSSAGVANLQAQHCWPNPPSLMNTSRWTLKLGKIELATVNFIAPNDTRPPEQQTFQFVQWRPEALSVVMAAGFQSDLQKFQVAGDALQAHFAAAGKIPKRWTDEELQHWLETCFRPKGIEPNVRPDKNPPSSLKIRVIGQRAGRYRLSVVAQEKGREGGGRVVASATRELSESGTVAVPVDRAAWSAVARDMHDGQWNLEAAPELTAREDDGLGPLRAGIPGSHSAAPVRSVSVPWPGA